MSGGAGVLGGKAAGHGFAGGSPAPRGRRARARVRVRRRPRAVAASPSRASRARVGHRPARDGRRHARRPRGKASASDSPSPARGAAALRAFRGRRRRDSERLARDPFTERREHRTQNTERPYRRSVGTRLAPDAHRVGGGARVPPRVRSRDRRLGLRNGRPPPLRVRAKPRARVEPATPRLAPARVLRPIPAADADPPPPWIRVPGTRFIVDGLQGYGRDATRVGRANWFLARPRPTRYYKGLT